jgi:WhiB family redox-sensing transcriptional regulator
VSARRNGLPRLVVSTYEPDLSPIELVAPGPDHWRSRSLCSELPIAQADSLFFPARGQSSKAARALCSRCPVRAECLEIALNDTDASESFVGGATSVVAKLLIQQVHE